MRLRTLLALTLWASAVPAAAAELNLVSKVEVKDQGGTLSVVIQGSKPANFTTFSMVDPPRFVIDLSEASFKGVPEDIAVRDGTLQVIKNLAYAGDGGTVARVMLAFQREVDPPEVAAVGNSLVVTVARRPGTLVAQAPPPPEPTRAPPARPAEPTAATTAALVTPPVEPVPAAPSAPVARPVEPVAAAPSAPAARPAEPAVASTPAPAPAARPEPKPEPKAKATRLAKLSDGGDARAQAKRESDEKARPESKRAAKPAQALAAAEPASAPAPEVASPAPQAPTAPPAAEPPVAVAAAPSPTVAKEPVAKVPEEGAARVEATRGFEQPRAEQPGGAAANAPEERGATADQADLPGQRQPEPAVRKRPSLAVAGEGPRHIREVGFRQMGESSRLFVRISAAPRFRIVEAGEKTIRVELPNTRVARRNDARHLDTSFFASAVAMVVPRREGSSTVLEITLKEKVPYQQRVDGDTLSIDFERPASGSLAPGAPAVEKAPASVD